MVSNKINWNLIIRFIIYGLLGWCIEIFWTGLSSLLNGEVSLTGQTYLWMFPIYGLAIFLELVYEKTKELSIITRGLIYTIIIFTIEYLTGWILLNTIGVCPWEYTTPYAINGLIRLDYAPAWFLAGLLFEQIYQKLKILQNIYQSI